MNQAESKVARLTEKLAAEKQKLKEAEDALAKVQAEAEKAEKEAPKRRGGEQGFKSSQQRKQLESLKNDLKRQLQGKQREAFKQAVEKEKLGEQFLDKETLQQIFDEIRSTAKP